MAQFEPPVGIHMRKWRSPGISIAYPVVYGLPNPRAEERMNQIIGQAVSFLYDEQLKVQTGSNMEMTGHYEIKTNERGLLSLILTNYAYSYPMAHGFTVAKSLSFNINTGQTYSLADLFRKGADYVGLLSKLVSAQIKQRDLPLLQSFDSISPDQDFYLADKSLVLYYQLYQLSPYYAGLPMFPVIIYDLQAIAAENGPLDTLAASVV